MGCVGGKPSTTDWPSEQVVRLENLIEHVICCLGIFMVYVLKCLYPLQLKISVKLRKKEKNYGKTNPITTQGNENQSFLSLKS